MIKVDNPSDFYGSVEISWGLFFILVKYCLLRIMKNDYLNMLASLVLPAQILDYFLSSTYKCNFLGADNKQ